MRQNVTAVAVALVLSAIPLSASQQQGTVFAVETGVTPPVAVKQVRPTYTAQALKAKIEGQATLSAVVRADGKVSDVRIVQSVDPTYGLDQKAIEALSQWTFQPGEKGGKPVPVTIEVAMAFQLRR
jgi:TonB family protein